MAVIKQVIKTYGTIIFNKDKDEWVITKAQPHVCIKLKKIFPKIMATAIAPFNFKNSPENCTDLSWFMQRYPLDISSNDLQRINKGDKLNIETINSMENIFMPDYNPKSFVLKDLYKAREYQLKANELHLKCKRLLLGDDIGLGKTLTGILSFMNQGACPGAVVCQVHLMTHWQNEIIKYTYLTCHIIKTRSAYNLPPADIYIFSYSRLSGWVNLFTTGYFKSTVFDEVQELRCSNSSKYESAKSLSNNSDKVLALSATPIYNYGDEIFTIMDLIKPGCLNSKEEFMREWTKNWKEVSDPKALGSYLRENFLFLRRTRKDVGMEMPKVNTIVHEVDYDHEEVEKSEDLLRQLAIKVTTGSFIERGQASREFDMFMRQMTGISKARYVATFVKMLLDNGEPVLLAGWHREVYEIWLRELAEYNPVMYTGSESIKQKNDNKEKFISGATKLMIISLRSGVGLDGLQKVCSTVVVGELDWSPKVHEQLIGRVDRDGQLDPVTALYLVANAGSDPFIVDLLAIKSNQSSRIIDPLDGITIQHSDDSRIKLLAEAVLSKHKTKEPA